MISVALLPEALEGMPGGGAGAQVVVLDVLRATSTIVTGLSAGAREVRLFGSLDVAREARRKWGSERGKGPVLLAGETQCLKPADFDLGNSPREQVTEKVGNAVILLATTNGTRAAVRARDAGARRMFVGSVLNASATARALLPQVDTMDTVLLCAGTQGTIALEDVIGAGAILFAILQASYRTDLAFTDTAWMAYHTFAAVRQRLPAALRLGQGGINVIEAGLEDDIDHCARLDALPLVAPIEATGDDLIVHKAD
jgi:2-phosphosulfolactate phosphatase